MSPVPLVVDCASVFRDRRRSFIGDGACSIGGVGCCACDDAGGVTGSDSIDGRGSGDVRSDWSERHVEKMLPMAVDSWGGLAGGEAKRAGWRRVSGGCDASQDKADGSNMILSFVQLNSWRIVYGIWLWKEGRAKGSYNGAVRCLCWRVGEMREAGTGDSLRQSRNALSVTRR